MKTSYKESHDRITLMVAGPDGKFSKPDLRITWSRSGVRVVGAATIQEPTIRQIFAAARKAEDPKDGETVGHTTSRIAKVLEAAADFEAVPSLLAGI